MTEAWKVRILASEGLTCETSQAGPGRWGSTGNGPVNLPLSEGISGVEGLGRGPDRPTGPTAEVTSNRGWPGPMVLKAKPSRTSRWR
jgi:hypothetical protein